MGMLDALLARPPAVGSVWKDKDWNPFDDRTATVLSVNRGWVQYRVDFPTGPNYVTASSIRLFRRTFVEFKQ